MITLSFLELVHNAALLLSLVLVFDIFVSRWRTGQEAAFQHRLLAGLILGVIGVAVMLTPWVLVPGLVFDTRSVLLSISGLFFGPVPTLIAMVITATLRMLQGGPGVWPGVSTVLVTGSLGLIWRRLRRGTLDEIKLPELYLFGLVTHLIMLALMFTLPWEMAVHTLRNISAPVLVIYPIASALLGGLMANRLKREKLIEEQQRAEEALAQERRLLRTLIDNLPDAIYAKDSEGRKTLANRADLDNIGLSEAEVLGKTDEELFPPEIAASFMADDQAVLSTGVPLLNRQEYLSNANGRELWQRTSKLPLFDANRQVVGLVGIGRDITEYRQAMDALQQNETYLRTILQTTAEGFWVVNTVGRLIDVNAAYCAMSGYSRDEVLTLCINDIDVVEDPPATAARMQRIIENGAEIFETHHRRKDGSVFDVELSVTYLDADGGKFIGFCRDITERKQAMEALRAERNLVSRIMETNPVGIVMVNREGQIEFANPQAEQVLGLSRDKIRQRHYNAPEWRITDYNGDPFPKDQLPFVQVQRTLHTVTDIRHAIEWPDGRRILLKINAAPMFDEHSAFNGVINTVEDVTAQVEAQEMLRMTQFAIEQAAIEVYWIDKDGHFIYVNKRACEALGYTPEQLLTLGVTDVDPDFSPERWQSHWQEIQQRKTFTLESRHRTREGHIYPVEITVNYLEYNGKGYNFAFGVDITERKRAESEKEKILAALRESEQKYRALFEQMTEGFALHEIVTDAQGVPCDYRFLEINPAYEQITGLKRADCLGKTVLEILPGLDPHWITDYGNVALTGEPAYLEDYVPELERYYEVWAYSPRPWQFATLVKDVTERRHQEIERATLLEAEREQRLRAETLRDVTLALASALDTSDVLMEILHQAQRLVPSTASNIALVEGEALHIVGWRGYAEYGSEQDIAGMIQPLSDFSISAEVIATGKPYITADTHDDPRWLRLPATVWLCAHISLPIFLDKHVVGVLRLDSDQVGTFSPQDVERLLPLTRAAAIALENARLYTQAQQELEERKRSQAALEASERKFREMLENMHLVALMLDLEGRVTFCNDFGLELVGMERDAVFGRDWFDTFIPPEVRGEMHVAFAQHFATGDFPQHHENEILTAGGTTRALIAWNNMVVRDPDNNIIGVSAIGEDITARRAAESALKASEAWLRSFVDSMDDVIFSLDTEQRHTALYGQWIERMGMSPEYFLGRTAREVFGAEAARVHETANRQVLTTGASVTYEWEVNDAHFQTTLSPLHGPEGEVIGIVGVGRDITALKDYQMQLQTALDEKTLMLSEIHHRIKNNLQVILGLLELQFGAIEDEATQQMLRESQNRIKAIALIHERLYQTPGESQVSAQLYFQSLTRYLTQTYDAMVRGIVVEQSIADLELNIDLAIPCALIMNELIANALKYAFPPKWQSPDGAPPTLRVALHQVDGHARLEVADNGVGLPESVESETSTRLGLRLIKMLTRQIDGELSIAQNAGTCIAVTFTWNEEK
ncbi:MAG: PAS domain S-box protein [Anaerolineae bacterium]|nr:PAS domain S-box protein [Anaerolineae bacterium]